MRGNLGSFERKHHMTSSFSNSWWGGEGATVSGFLYPRTDICITRLDQVSNYRLASNNRLLIIRHLHDEPFRQFRLHVRQEATRRLEHVVGATHQLKRSQRHGLQRQPDFDGCRLQ